MSNQEKIDEIIKKLESNIKNVARRRINDAGQLIRGEMTRNRGRQRLRDLFRVKGEMWEFLTNAVVEDDVDLTEMNFQQAKRINQLARDDEGSSAIVGMAATNSFNRAGLRMFPQLFEVDENDFDDAQQKAVFRMTQRRLSRKLDVLPLLKRVFDSE